MSRGNIVSVTIGSAFLIVMGILIPALGLAMLIIAALAAVLFPLMNL